MKKRKNKFGTVTLWDPAFNLPNNHTIKVLNQSTHPCCFAVHILGVYIADQTVVGNFASFLVAEVNITAGDITMYNLQMAKNKENK